MADSYVIFPETRVMRVRAEMNGKGPSAAFNILESKLPTLKKRRFYGIYRATTEGEEYYACVAIEEGDDPHSMGLETGVIPGGRYVRRKVLDWENLIGRGPLPKIAGEMATKYQHELAFKDSFTIEYYRSHEELQLLMPMKGDSK